MPLTQTQIDRGGPGSKVLEVEEADPNYNPNAELAAVLIDQSPDDFEPTTYEQAWNHEDSAKCQIWRDAINH